MTATDRSMALLVTIGAIVAWLGTAVVLTSVHPESAPLGRSVGALAIGAAVAFTAWPLLWFIAGRRDPSGIGAWGNAARRALLVGLVVSVVVLLRAIDAFTLPTLIFVLGTAVVVELAFGVRRRAQSR